MVTRSGGAAGRWWVRARHRRTLVLVPCQLLHTLSVLSLPQELLVWTPSSLCEMNMARRSGGAAKTAMWVFHLGSHLCSWLLVRLWRCRRGGKIPLVVGYATRGSTGLWCRVLCAGSCALQRSGGLLGVVLVWCGKGEKLPAGDRHHRK